MAIKYTKWPKYIPNGHKMYQHFPFQGLQKFTQSGILVSKHTIWQPWIAVVLASDVTLGAGETKIYEK
jgi:hypothetical protein